MKILMQLLVPILFITAIGENQNSTAISYGESTDNEMYNVEKIDSINSYFLVYLKNKDSWFKLISHKDYSKFSSDFSGQACAKDSVDLKVYSNSVMIRKETFYEFELISLLCMFPYLSRHDVMGYRLDDSTTVYLEGDSIVDLFYARNMKGLFVYSD